ncbi:MAG: hypothetical protein ACFFCF_08795 [Promethearchaeota archaeon]
MEYGKRTEQQIQPDSSDTVESKQSIFEMQAQTKFIAIALLYAFSILATSTFLRLPILIPTQWVSVVFFVLITPIFLYSFSAMVRPLMVIAICFPSLALGELLWCALFGCGGELLVNLIFTFSTWGIACLLISLLRTRNELLAMFTGGLWTFLGLLVPATIYYAFILDWSALYMIVYALLAMSVHVVLIPFAFILNRVVHKLLEVQFFDELVLLE